MTHPSKEKAPRKRYLFLRPKSGTGGQKVGMRPGGTTSFTTHAGTSGLAHEGPRLEAYVFYMALAVFIGLASGLLGDMAFAHLSGAPWHIGTAISLIGPGILGFGILLIGIGLLFPRIPECIVAAFAGYLTYWVAAPALFTASPQLAASLLTPDYAQSITDGSTPIVKPWLQNLTSNLVQALR